MIRTLFIISLLLLSGCDAVNCIINNHPEFSKTSLNPATLNQVYEDTITASISNSIEDSKYNYDISLKGELPAGISYRTSGPEITFSGTPTELGEFPISLTVTATAKFLGPNFPDDNEPEALCNNTEVREMVFSVVQGF